jgi:hypothetical protein
MFRLEIRCATYQNFARANRALEMPCDPNSKKNIQKKSLPKKITKQRPQQSSKHTLACCV